MNFEVKLNFMKSLCVNKLMCNYSSVLKKTICTRISLFFFSITPREKRKIKKRKDSTKWDRCDSILKTSQTPTFNQKFEIKF